MTDLLVIGSGYFGSWAARLARSRGLDVTVVDAGLQTRATRCAAGLICAPWLARYGREALEGYERLRAGAWDGVRPTAVRLTAMQRPQKGVNFDCLPPAAVQVQPDVAARVEGLERVPAGWNALTRAGAAAGALFARNVYIAAGTAAWTVWAKAPAFASKRGGAWVFEAGPALSSLWSYAPYRQAVAFARPGDPPGSLYYSDGTALQPASYTRERRGASWSRAVQLGLGGAALEFIGDRPYPLNRTASPALHALEPGLWCAGAGQKAGAVLGGVAAERLLRELCG